MKLGKYKKQPGERQSLSITYEDCLTEGDNVASATATIVPPGLTVDSITLIDPRVKFWVQGGTDKVDYIVTIVTQTVDGRTFHDEITVQVREI